MAISKKQREKPSLGQETAAVAGICFAVFLLLCFVSFSLQQDTLSMGRPVAANWGGSVGYFIAGVLLGFMGLSSLWLIILLSFFSFQFFSPKASIDRLPYICAGCTGILISSSTLAAAFGREAMQLFGNSYPVGGYLGKLLFSFSGRYFGGPGTVLIFVSLFMLSLMISIRFSPYSLSWKLVDICGWFGERFRQRKKDASALPRSMGGKDVQAAVIKEQDAGPVTTAVPRVHEPVRLDFEGDDGEFHPLPVSSGEYRLPGIGLLDKPDAGEFVVAREHYYAVSKQLEEKLYDFGVTGKVVGISPGPVITTYEFSPAPGVKINRVVSLADDLALGLKAESVRIVGSIPGKAAIGIEIPNPERQIVFVRDIFAHDSFQKSTSKLTMGLGMDVVGNPVMANLARMPHLLIAGATGAGKSVAVNSIICSMLFKATPDEVRLLMIDPKRIELSGYEAIPHLLHPVVTDPKMASRSLLWAVREMERRYELMEERRVKNLDSYNKISEEKLPLIVIIIDELADLMMVSSREVEDAVTRLAQMARAAGMHLILATQRPSVDVLTGLIKANFPTRMSFKVSSKIDSRTILDTSGAEHLLGAGDMLFLPPGSAKLQRIHGAYISEQEIERIVQFWREQGTARYDESVMQIVEEPEETDEMIDDYDEKYDEAVALVCETSQASISMVQRRLRVGYNRAARMIEIMEKEGVVGPADGSKPREVLARKAYS